MFESCRDRQIFKHLAAANLLHFHFLLRFCSRLDLLPAPLNLKLRRNTEDRARQSSGAQDIFKVNREANAIEALESRTFAELGFKERHNLQEWIAKMPSGLGEELLIIKKEFAGFSDTQERLDLLAVDKQGSLVLIEISLTIQAKTLSTSVTG